MLPWIDPAGVPIVARTAAWPRDSTADRGVMLRALFCRALAISVALLTASCGSTVDVPVDPSPPFVSPTTRSTTDASPPATGTPIPSALQTPSPDSDYPYPIGMTIQVVADAVRVREAPGTGTEVVGALARDTRAAIVDGPLDADGHTWFEIKATSVSGWVATGDAEDRWIVAVPAVERSELAFRFRSMCDVTPPLVSPTLTVTADRHVVALEPNEGGWIVGRLTPPAFSEVMALVDHPALDMSASYRPEIRPGAGDPPGHGLCIYEFTLGPPDERIRVTSVSWFGEEEESAFYLPAPERRALSEVAQRLMLGGGLFTDASWETPPTEYEAETFLVWIWPDAASPSLGVPSVTDLDMLGNGNEFGEPIRSGRCGYLHRTDAEGMADAFAGGPSPMALNATSYLTAATGTGWVNVVTSPMTPDGFPTCGDVPG